MKTTRVDFRIQPEEKEKLARLADRQEITASEWIRDKINDDYEKIFGETQRPQTV